MPTPKDWSADPFLAARAEEERKGLREGAQTAALAEGDPDPAAKGLNAALGIVGTPSKRTSESSEGLPEFIPYTSATAHSVGEPAPLAHSVVKTRTPALQWAYEESQRTLNGADLHVPPPERILHSVRDPAVVVARAAWEATIRFVALTHPLNALPAWDACGFTQQDALVGRVRACLVYGSATAPGVQRDEITAHFDALTVMLVAYYRAQVVTRVVPDGGAT